MSENTNGTAEAGEANGSTDEFKAPATQADLDRIIQDRVARERNKYADYEEVKAKASQADAFQSRIGELEASNTELSGKVTAFESKTERTALLDKVATAAGVPASALRGADEDELTAHAAELKALLTPSAPVVPTAGQTPGTPPDDPDRKAVRELFG